MGNATDLLKFGAKVLIVIAIIAIGIAFFTQGQEVTKSAEKDVSALSQTMEAKKYEAYNGTAVSGAQVVNAVRQFAESGKLTVTVKTKSNTTGITYNNSTIKYTITDQALADYINPNGSFLSVLANNTNGLASSMTFTQQ